MSDFTYYRGCIISAECPPVAIRGCDWSWWHDDDEGPGGRHGYAESPEACKRAIDKAYDEGELP